MGGFLQASTQPHNPRNNQPGSPAHLLTLVQRDRLHRRVVPWRLDHHHVCPPRDRTHTRVRFRHIHPAQLPQVLPTRPHIVRVLSGSCCGCSCSSLRVWLCQELLWGAAHKVLGVDQKAGGRDVRDCQRALTVSRSGVRVA